MYLYVYQYLYFFLWCIYQISMFLGYTNIYTYMKNSRYMPGSIVSSKNSLVEPLSDRSQVLLRPTSNYWLAPRQMAESMACDSNWDSFMGFKWETIGLWWGLIWIYIYTHMYVYKYIHIYIHTHMYVYVYVHIYIYLSIYQHWGLI